MFTRKSVSSSRSPLETIRQREARWRLRPAEAASQRRSSAPPEATQFIIRFTRRNSRSLTSRIFGAARGGKSRILEALKENQRFMNEATFLTLTSNIALGAIQEASLREQITVTNRLIAISRDILEKVRLQKELGQLTELNVAGQEALVAQTEATLPPLRKALAQQRDALIVLSGHLPGEGLHGEIRVFLVEASTASACEPALRAGIPKARCPGGGGKLPRRLRAYRRCDRKSSAAIFAERRHRPQRAPVPKPVQRQSRFLFLYRRRECVAGHLRRVHLAAKAARRRSRVSTRRRRNIVWRFSRHSRMSPTRFTRSVTIPSRLQKAILAEAAAAKDAETDAHSIK